MTVAATRVSLVINNHNYGRYLRQCIESCLEQTVPADVVVVDDGSDDESRSILAEYGSRITAVLQPNGGQAAAVNAGIAASTGDIVAFLDSDDWVFADKVEAIADAFQASRAEWLRHDLQLVDDDASVGSSLYSFPRRDTPYVDYLSLGDTPGTMSALAFRRQFLVEVVGAVPEAPFRTFADVYLKCSGAFLGEVVDVPRSLGVRRLHHGQITMRRGGTSGRVEGRIRYRSAIAERSAELAQRAAPATDRPVEVTLVARRDSWWQLRADLHAACLDRRLRERCVLWFRYVRRLRQSTLSWQRQVGFAGREAMLAAMPRRWFTRAWWSTNDGRPAYHPQFDDSQ
jgi:glycosyltransferase involved in cell wall biosynthesis